jgi:hypothetical protein
MVLNVMQNVAIKHIMKSVVILRVIVLNVIMLCVIMPVINLGVDTFSVVC